MATISVSTTAGLLSALRGAKSGDVIKLAAGNYSNVSLSNVQFSGNVTIESADKNRPAVLSDIALSNVKNLTVQNLEFAVNPARGDNPIKVLGSTNIVFDNVDVHGTMNDDPNDDVAGMLVRNSNSVTVKNSEFQQLSFALGHLDNNGLTFTGNSFHDLRSDGIRGGGSSNVLVANNYFSSFFPNSVDHPDAIQFWTLNTTRSVSNITVRDNIIERGDGKQMQGIFFGNEANQTYQNVTITDNVLVGTGYNGIALKGGQNVTVHDNQIVSIEGSRSWVRLDNVRNGSVTENSAIEYLYTGLTNVTRANNIMNAPVTAAQADKMVESIMGRGRDLNLAQAPRMLAEHLDTVIENVAVVDLTDPALLDRIVLKTTVVAGTDGADRLTAGAIGKFMLDGGLGNDSLTGNGTSAELHGGKGNDGYTVKGVGDIVVEKAGDGYDTVATSVDYRLTANVEELWLSKAGLTGYGNELDNRLIGSAGEDILYGEGGADLIQGGNGNDIFYGGAGDDDLRGDAGNDRLFGGDGADKLAGGDGNDVIYGGSGNDIIYSGAGVDTLYGEAGADQFMFRNGDFGVSSAESLKMSTALAHVAGDALTGSLKTIGDFSRAQGDKINLGGIDANTKTAVDDKFAFVGTAGFSKKAGELRYEVVSGSTYVYGDVNGDGVADLSLKLAGVTSVVASDFVL